MQELEREWYDGPRLVAWLAECAIRYPEYGRWYNDHNRRVLKRCAEGAAINARQADTLLIPVGLHLHLIPPEVRRDEPAPDELRADNRRGRKVKVAHYPASFRDEVLRCMAEERLAVAEVARRFTISPKSVRNWRDEGIGAAR